MGYNVRVPFRVAPKLNSSRNKKFGLVTFKLDGKTLTNLSSTDTIIPPNLSYFPQKLEEKGRGWGLTCGLCSKVKWKPLFRALRTLPITLLQVQVNINTFIRPTPQACYYLCTETEVPLVLLMWINLR